MYGSINQSILEAKRESKYKEKELASFIDKTDMDPWDIETHVDISKGLSQEDRQNIMSMKRVINSYFILYIDYILLLFFTLI